MNCLNLDAFRQARLQTDPYEFAIVPQFINPTAMPRILADYPRIEQAGSFPLESLEFGSHFAALCDELRGNAMRELFAEKFGMDLADRPTTLTVRGHCRQKDGKIHVDSRTKLITVLIYLNGPWEADGGRLRLLRSRDMQDVLAEAPPEQGTLVCFRNRANAWHGHLPYAGVRRVLQLNWVTDQSAVLTSSRRHRISAFLKRWLPLRRAA